MFFLRPAEDDDVVQVDEAGLPGQPPQSGLHQALERCRATVSGVWKTRSFHDHILPIPGCQVKCAEPLGPCQRVQGIIYTRDWLRVIPLLHQDYRLAPWQRGGCFTGRASAVSIRCWTRFVRPTSVSPREMVFPHRRGTSLRARLSRGEHSAPSTRERPYSCGSPSPMSGFPSVVFSAPASQEFGVTHAQPMSCRLFGADSRLISTFEPSVILVLRACQSTTFTNRSKKFVPRIHGTTKLFTTTTGTRPLQLPSCSGITPRPQMHIFHPSPDRMDPSAVLLGWPLVALRQVDSDTTETTAPLSSSKGIFKPFNLPATSGEHPVFNSVMARSRRSVDPLRCAPAGRVRGRSWGQLRLRWSKLPQLKHPVPVLAGRADVRSSLSNLASIVAWCLR
ncbi:hypothetical protein T07_2758 [Trichinella nelsoni]|uniref:Uncharacterized protein n=1 Tax=Trichinella nelsoni TaxID=6336 RepID=A0A0V0SAX8_9BILA|nr:hypothetical protein T07_2758 [Trichinella nelsoni]